MKKITNRQTSDEFFSKYRRGNLIKMWSFKNFYGQKKKSDIKGVRTLDLQDFSLLYDPQSYNWFVTSSLTIAFISATNNFSETNCNLAKIKKTSVKKVTWKQNETL